MPNSVLVATAGEGQARKRGRELDGLMADGKRQRNTDDKDVVDENEKEEGEMDAEPTPGRSQAVDLIVVSARVPDRFCE